MTDSVRPLIDRIHDTAMSADIKRPHLDLTPAQIRRNHTLDRPVSLIALVAIITIALNVVLGVVGLDWLTVAWSRLTPPLTMLLVVLGVPILNCVVLCLYLLQRPFLVRSGDHCE